MHKHIIPLTMAMLAYFAAATAQEKVALPKANLPLKPVKADSVKIGDFFWHLQLNDADKAVPKKTTRNSETKNTISESEWEETFHTLGIEGEINHDKEDVAAICDFVGQCGKLMRKTGDARYISAMEHCYYNGLAGRMNDGNAANREAAASALRGLTGEFMATSGKHLFINMYTRSQSHIKNKHFNIEAIVTTSAPWFNEHWIELLTGGRKQKVVLHLKLPEWFQKEFLSNYEMNSNRYSPNVFVKGSKIIPRIEKGYVVIDNVWEDSTTIVLQFPTPTRHVCKKDKPDEIAIMKGHLLYAFIGVPPGMYIKRSDPIRAQFDKDRHTNVLSAPYYTKEGEKAGVYIAEPYAFNRRNPQARIFMKTLP